MILHEYIQYIHTYVHAYVRMHHCLIADVILISMHAYLYYDRLPLLHKT